MNKENRNHFLSSCVGHVDSTHYQPNLHACRRPTRPSPHSLHVAHLLGVFFHNPGRIPPNEGLVLYLPWGRGKSIGGDIDVGEESSEQTIVTLQSLHHGSIGYQHVRT
jgi:hypothetical protein